MEIDPRAGQPAIEGDLINVPKLVAAYHDERPDPEIPAQRVIFGTSWTLRFILYAHRQSVARLGRQDPHGPSSEYAMRPLIEAEAQTIAKQAFASEAPAPIPPQLQETK